MNKATCASNISTKDLNKLHLIFIPLSDNTRYILENISSNGLKEIFQVSNVEICDPKTRNGLILGMLLNIKSSNLEQKDFAFQEFVEAINEFL